MHGSHQLGFTAEAQAQVFAEGDKVVARAAVKKVLHVDHVARDGSITTPRVCLCLCCDDVRATGVLICLAIACAVFKSRTSSGYYRKTSGGVVLCSVKGKGFLYRMYK